MRPELARILAAADLRGWGEVEVEHGPRQLAIRVPAGARILGMKATRPLPDAAAAIREAIERPIESPTLAELVAARGKAPATLTVCIATSDITRPVPYRGPAGILAPLLEALERAGVRRQNVTLLVGTGTHRPSTAEEKVAMFGAEVVASCQVADHVCDDEAAFVALGRTRSGAEILVNRRFAEADLRIATGLVEAHFMAGVSGGRKAVCPALVSRRTIEHFHSARFLDSPRATNLVLEGNPCHEESLEVVRRVGVDFAVSAVLDRSLALVGIHAGHLERSHEAAYRQVREIVAVPVEAEHDIVLTHGGYVGVNHYQGAKAACNALPAVRAGGFVILAACERDPDPIGPVTYRTLLHLLKLQGWERYLAMLLSPGWTFTRDQWQPQMWGKVLAKLGEQGLVYCSARLPPRDAEVVPGRFGWEYLDTQPGGDEAAQAQAMVQNAVIACVHDPRWAGRTPTFAFVKEGPYAIPYRA
jgi:nickel-dependent lactate racemase